MAREVDWRPRVRRSLSAGVLLLLILGPIQSRADAEDLSKIPTINGRQSLVQMPYIQYPERAQRLRMSGSGIAVLEVDARTGNVTAARMARSTGEEVLDRAALGGLRQARFRPGTPGRVKIPITFTLFYGGQPNFVVKSKNMDDVLAHFLGKGTVLKGPIPAYPRNPPWTDKSGKGVYELHADKDGNVVQVKILKSSGHAVFDREAVKTLGKWRLRSGRALILELPLRFQLTPTNYSVDVGR